MPLDYNSSIPLYIQLKERLEQEIINGKYTGKIPSEREIMDEYYVSRSTVREAIKELVDDSILEKRPGKGTFVALKPINDWLGSLSSTSETITKMGMKDGAELIHASKIETPAPIRNEIELTEVFHIKRLRYADDIPIGVENSYYPLEIGEKLSRFDLNHVALYDLLEKQLGIRTKEATQVIRAGRIRQDDANLLKLPDTTTMLQVTRKLFNMNDEFVEFETASYRADMYSFSVNLARKYN